MGRNNFFKEKQSAQENSFSWCWFGIVILSEREKKILGMPSKDGIMD